MHGADVVKVQVTRHTSIFNDGVMEAPFPNNFKMPNIMSYNEKGDSVAHVEIF